MNVTALFIKRPVMTILVMLAILLFGVVGYRGLPVSDLPTIDFPTLTVRADLPGASAETMAASVATVLERQFSTVPGIENMTSSSSRGQTSVTLTFALERDIDLAAQDVEAAVSQVIRRLPNGMPNPPQVQKVNPADQAILFMGLNSDSVSPTVVADIADTLIAPRISQVEGVALVNVFGAAKYAVRVQLDPNKLAARGIGLDEVQTSIQRHNANLPSGTLWGSKQAYTVQANGQVMNADAYRPLIVAYRNGAPVRLDELGEVLDGVQQDKNFAWVAERRSIMFQVQRQPGTNTVEVVDRIKALIPEFERQLPPAVKLETVYDRSVSIRESVDDVKYTLLLTIGLVILVIFLFLRNVSATFIASMALPMSIVGTFAAMKALGHSLDNLSLMALTLAVGFVVDDAIVMLENIVRHMEMGKDRMQAAFDGSKEIGFTIISMTVSLTTVFIPILFMSGIVGRLFNEFAVVISVAILISGFVSLTLTPMMCSRMLKPPSENHGALYNFFERGFDLLRDGYRWSLDRVIRHRLVTVGVAIGTVFATYYVYRQLPVGFIPSQDTNQLSGTTEFSEDASFEVMVRLQKEVAAVLGKNENVETFFSNINAGNANNGSNSGRFQLRLKPRGEERTVSPEDIMEQLRPQVGAIPGVRVFFQNPPLIRIGGQQSRSLYQYTLQSQDLKDLYGSAAELERAFREIPELTDVSSDLKISAPLVEVDIDRDRAASLGITADQIETALYNAYGSRQISTIYSPVSDYAVIQELQPKYQQDPNALNMLYVRSSRGQLVPMNAIAHAKTTVGPLQVTHLGQMPSVTISFNLAPGVALGNAVDKIEETAALTLPDTVRTAFQGTAAAFQDSMTGMGLLIVLAIVVIYMVLGILYESFIHPITILTGLPAAGLGALATLWLFKSELNIYSFVGIIMLIGIVKKNAIMMIDFALEAQRLHNAPPEDAIYEACLVRFRPIMMTTMAALMGTLPIAMGLGAGSEARRPLGLCVVGGLVVSQLLTLYITPVFYIYMERLRSKFDRSERRSKSAPKRTAPEPVRETIAGD